MKDFVFVANFSGDILFMNREGDMLFGLSNMDRAFSSNLFESFSEKSKAEVQEKIEYAANKKQESIEAIKVETYLPNNCKVLNLMLNLIYDLHGEPTLLAGKLNCADVASDSFQFSKELYLG
ncbi:MAG: PAS domain-containing protein, partial [Bacteroidales bacterium]|nr:PAS domain-containing protein [Bacteroidales bacterium]